MALPVLLRTTPSRLFSIPCGFVRGLTSSQQQAAAIVSNVISQVKSSDIKGHVDSLEPHDLDTLMMYVYKGLAAGENSTALLQWHAAIVTKGGLGCIVRVLSARKSVL